jgi:hypothetical protein
MAIGYPARVKRPAERHSIAYAPNPAYTIQP